MKRKIVFWIVVWSAVSVPLASAAADFYGAKMKSESYAADLVMDEKGGVPVLSSEAPGIDKSVYAYGYFSGLLGFSNGLRIHVFNDSAKPISTDSRFREYALITKDGERYDLGESTMNWNTDTIQPKRSAMFDASLGGLDVRRDNIAMIVCSFDLGATKIILLPLPKKAAPPRPVPVEKKPAPAKTSVAAKTSVPAKPSPTKNFSRKSVPAPAAKPKEPPRASSPKQAANNFSKDRFKSSSAKPKPVPKPAPKPKSSAPPVAQTFFTKTKVFPSHGFTKPTQTAFRPVRSSVQIEEVNTQYGFVVIDAGSKDGLSPGMVFDVLREGRPVARVLVKKLKEHVSTGLILPGWTQQEIHAGDAISFHGMME